MLARLVAASKQAAFIGLVPVVILLGAMPAQAACNKDIDCAGENVCVKGACVSPTAQQLLCDTDKDCPSDSLCMNGRCSSEPSDMYDGPRARTMAPSKKAAPAVKKQEK